MQDFFEKKSVCFLVDTGGNAPERFPEKNTFLRGIPLYS